MIYSANPKPDIAFENLQICLEKLENYFRSNQLTLNATKTEFIRFSTPKMTVSNSQLMVAGSNIKLKKEVKYLGIIVDIKLTFEYQVKSVLQKTALGIKAIQTIRNNLPKKCLKVLLHALVLSHFEYCNLLLTDISSVLLLTLEKQLNWALKTVFYRSRNKCSTSLRISEEILSMKKSIDLKSFDLLYSILKNERSAFQNHLKLPTMSFRIIERNKKIILKEPGSSKFLHGSFFCTCVRSWNCILTKGVITPLYKKDDPLNPLNYRPITITSSLSKLFEKLLHKQIIQYLSSNKLLSPLQFGFCEKISTQDALIYFTESIRKHVDEPDTIYSVCIDLSKH